MTQLENLSETGLAFTVDSDPPQEDDMIKIEFVVPSRKQIACFATVVRVEQVELWHEKRGSYFTNKVSLEFRNLPQGHRQAISVGLKTKGAKDENLNDGLPFNYESFKLQNAVILSGLLSIVGLSWAWLFIPYPQLASLFQKFFTS